MRCLNNSIEEKSLTNLSNASTSIKIWTNWRIRRILARQEQCNNKKCRKLRQRTMTFMRTATMLIKNYNMRARRMRARMFGTHSLARTRSRVTIMLAHAGIRTCTHLDQWPADHPARKTSRETLVRRPTKIDRRGSRSLHIRRMPRNRSTTFGVHFAWIIRLVRCFPGSATRIEI